MLDDDNINAVCIGTWPYMHRTMTLAALDAGKHVLTEARMASTAAEARDMLAVSRAHPDLVCQLTPTSTSYAIDNVLKRLIDDGHLASCCRWTSRPYKTISPTLTARCTGATTGR